MFINNYNSLFFYVFKIVKLEIQMGSDKNYAILTQSSTLNKINVFKNYNPRIDYMEYININPTCYIIPT